MPYPTAPTNPIPVVATDANYNAPGDDWDGLPTKVAPSATVETQGYIPGEPRPADYDNYLYSTISEWLAYLEDYDTELTAVKATGAASSTDNAIARFDGTGGKTLQNSGIKVSDAAEFEYTTPPTRTVIIPPSMLIFRPSAANTEVDASEIYAATDSVVGRYDLSTRLPTGALITSVEFDVTPGDARTGSNKVELRLVTVTDAGATTTVDSDTDDGTTGAQTLSLTGLPVSVTNGTAAYLIEIKAGHNAAANNDIFRMLVVEYTDPGPRNY